MKDLVLIGGGGHCRSCIDIIEMEGNFRIAGVVDFPEKSAQNLLGYDYIGTDGDLPDLTKKFDNFFITLGQIKSSKRRIQLFQILKKLKVNIPIIVSPTAYISKHAQIMEGTIIMHHAVVNAGAVIGRNCIINNKALVEHDAAIGDYCHIATAAIINGGVKILPGTFLGSNSVIRENIKVGENVIIGFGAKVFQNISSNTIFK